MVKCTRTEIQKAMYRLLAKLGDFDLSGKCAHYIVPDAYGGQADIFRTRLLATNEEVAVKQFRFSLSKDIMRTKVSRLFLSVASC